MTDQFKVLTWDEMNKLISTGILHLVPRPHASHLDHRGLHHSDLCRSDVMKTAVHFFSMDTNLDRAILWQEMAYIAYLRSLDLLDQGRPRQAIDSQHEAAACYAYVRELMGIES